MATSTLNENRESLLASLLSEEAFRPSEPRSLEEAGLPSSLVEALVCKYLNIAGVSSGRTIANLLCLPFGILEGVFQSLRTRQVIMHTGSAALSDYSYSLTEQGRTRAQSYLEACAYVGPAPVPLADYVLSVASSDDSGRSPQAGPIDRGVCRHFSRTPCCSRAWARQSIPAPDCFSTARRATANRPWHERITMCFGQHIWIPQTLIEDGQLIKLYDSAYHELIENHEESLLRAATFDRRWVKIRRPTVVVGGELTMDNLEIRHDPRCNVSEAPLQLKSNCGCLLIDDFGRQRIEPADLLNRWIIPLENRHDYLTLSTGKKFQVPFEQLIIFSTNLEPSDLVDEAFLRRIPYKIEIDNPDEQEFHELFELYCKTFGCEYRPDVVEYLEATHYRPKQSPAATVPSPRSAEPDSQLLRVQRPANGNAARVLRSRDRQLLHGRRGQGIGPEFPHRPVRLPVRRLSKVGGTAALRLDETFRGQVSRRSRDPA